MTRQERVIEFLEKCYLPVSVKTIEEETGIPARGVNKTLPKLRKKGLVRRCPNGCQGTRLYELDTEEKRAYREKMKAAADALELKKKLGPKLFELLKRAKATVKTPGLKADIEKILEEVESCSVPKS